MVADHHAENESRVREWCPRAQFLRDEKAIWENPGISCVVIATQAGTHFPLIQKALESQKHVLVEKPFTVTVEQADILLKSASKKFLQIFVDHTLLFSSHYQTFKKEFHSRPRNGTSTYLSQRTGPGPFPKDCGVVPHLLYHDLYLLEDLVGLRNLSLTRCLDHAYQAYLEFTDSKGTNYFLNADLTSKEKTRRISWTTNGETTTWNDNTIPTKEPLAAMLEHTLDCLVTGKPALHSAAQARKIMQTVSEIEERLKQPERIAA